jgi:hypothetical protein
VVRRLVVLAGARFVLVGIGLSLFSSTFGLLGFSSSRCVEARGAVLPEPR